MKYLLLAIFMLTLIASPQSFANEAPPINDAEAQTRVDAISKTLRCVVCQNQSIYDSSAPLAEDMRSLVEKRVLAGDSDAEVREYLRERYGDFVLMTPPVQANTLLLWLGPILLLIAGGVWYFLRLRQPVVELSDTLSEADRQRVQDALSGHEQDT